MPPVHSAFRAGRGIAISQQRRFKISVDTVTPVGILIHRFLVVFAITQICSTGTGLPESNVFSSRLRGPASLAGAQHQNTELDANVPPSIEI